MTKEHDSPIPTPASSESEIQTTIMPREDLGALGLSARACKILSRAGVSTKSQLVNLWRHGDMRCIWELDPSDIRQVQRIVGVSGEKATIEQVPIQEPATPTSADDVQRDATVAEEEVDEVEVEDITRSLDDDISVLGLPERIETSLRNSGKRTLSQLADLGIDEILEIPGIGMNDLEEIDVALLSLRGQRMGEASLAATLPIRDVPLRLTRLQVLGLNKEIVEQLAATKIWSVQDLVDCTDAALLRKLHFKPNTIYEIRRRLNKYLSRLLPDTIEQSTDGIKRSSQTDSVKAAEEAEQKKVNILMSSSLLASYRNVERVRRLRDVYVPKMGAAKDDDASLKLVMEYPKMVPLEALGLSSAAYNRLRRGRITSLGELLDSTWEELASIWYMGQKTLKEIAVKLDNYLSSHPIIDSPVEADAITDSFLNERIAEPSLVAQLQNANVLLDKIPVNVLNLYPGIKMGLRKANILTIQDLCNCTEADLLSMYGVGVLKVRQIKELLNSFLAERLGSISGPDPLQEEISRLYELAGQLCKILESQNLLGDIRLSPQAEKILTQAIGAQVETIADLQEVIMTHDSTAVPFDLKQALERRSALKESIGWLDQALNFKSVGDEVNYLVNSLDPREQLIFTSRYIGENKRTLQEIGKELGLTRERVRQIEGKALRKLASKTTKAPFLYTKASLILLKRMGEEATLESWKQGLLDSGFLKEESSFGLLAAICSATKGLGHALSEEAIELPGKDISRHLLSFKKAVLQTARKLNRNSGAVRAVSLTTEELSEAEVAKILSSGGFVEIDPGWWTKAGGESVPERVAEKVIAHCGPVSALAIRHALRRHLLRLQFPTPPSEVLVKALEKRGKFIVVNGLLQVSKPLHKEPVLTGPESVFLEVIRTEGPVVSFELLHAKVMEQGLSGASAGQFLSYSPLVQRIEVGLYILLGTKCDASDIEKARLSLTRVPAMASIKPRSDGIVDFETNVGNWLVYGGIVSAGPAASMKGPWRIVDQGNDKGNLTVGGNLIRGLSQVATDLGLVSGDRIRIEFNTWTREAKITKVVNHGESLRYERS